MDYIRHQQQLTEARMCVCVCMCMYVCVCVYMCMCVCVCVCVYVALRGPGRGGSLCTLPRARSKEYSTRDRESDVVCLDCVHVNIIVVVETPCSAETNIDIRTYIYLGRGRVKVKHSDPRGGYLATIYGFGYTKHCVAKSALSASYSAWGEVVPCRLCMCVCRS